MQQRARSLTKLNGTGTDAPANRPSALLLRVVLLVVAAFAGVWLLAACGSTSSEAACPATVRFENRLYTGSGTLGLDHYAVGDVAGKGERLISCADEPPQDPVDKWAPVTVRRVEGFPTTSVIALDGELRDALYVSDSTLDRCRGRDAAAWWACAGQT